LEYNLKGSEYCFKNTLIAIVFFNNIPNLFIAYLLIPNISKQTEYSFRTTLMKAEIQTNETNEKESRNWSEAEFRKASRVSKYCLSLLKCRSEGRNIQIASP